MVDDDLNAGSAIGMKRLTRRQFAIAGAGVVGLTLLQACGGQEPEPDATSTTSTGTGAGAGASPEATTPAVADATATAPVEVEHKTGGTIKVVMIGEPPVVADAMFTTTTVTSDITRQVYEGLFTQDSKFGPQPMLVDAYEISDDGLNYTFNLREGVKFHNGKDFTSVDALASLNRWGLMTGRGKMIVARLAEDGLKAEDPLTVTMSFTEPAGVLLNFLSMIEAFMLPEEIATEVGTEKIPDEQIIGTGPFMFKEHLVDRLIRLVRYDGYTAREEEPDGLSGKKTVYIDELHVIPVPDVTVATNGVITGEFHFAITVENDQYDTVANDENLDPLIVKPGGWICVNYNKQAGAFMNKQLRQAVSMCFDRQRALIAAYGRQELTRMDPGIAMPETIWNSQAGVEVYEKVDTEAAKALLAEAGYNGETLRWLTTKEYPYHYNTAAYIAQEMEAIGMKVELVVSDWATVVQRRADSSVYEMIIAGLSGWAHPATQPFNDAAWPGWWDSAEKDDVVGRLVSESDPVKAAEIIEEYQALIYEELPFMKIGDNFTLQVIRKEIKGYTSGNGWFFWNTSIS